MLSSLFQGCQVQLQWSQKAFGPRSQGANKVQFAEELLTAQHTELIGLNCAMNQIRVFPPLVLWQLPS